MSSRTYVIGVGMTKFEKPGSRWGSQAGGVAMGLAAEADPALGAWTLPESVRDAGGAGLFGPDSITWRINRENALGAVGGGRALILQVAHPLVGAGVSEHSDYRHRPWDRLFRTLDTVTAIVFGTPDDAEEAARRVWNVHGRVRGSLSEDQGRYPKGSPYDARDPDPAMWVQATLIETALLVYDRFVEPLSLPEREAYYEEQKLFGEMFGVPRERQPATYAEFNDYFEHMVENELVVTDVVRDVLDAIQNPELPVVSRTFAEPLVRPLASPLFAPLRLATVGLLPERLREELGAPWGAGRERALNASAALMRTLLPLLPGLVREFPQARRADRRLKAAA